jgi:hypothetical protein
MSEQTTITSTRVWTINELDQAHPKVRAAGWRWFINEYGEPSAVRVEPHVFHGDHRVWVTDWGSVCSHWVDSDGQQVPLLPGQSEDAPGDVCFAVVLARRGLDSPEAMTAAAYRLGREHERADVVDFIKYPPGRLPDHMRQSISELRQALERGQHEGGGKRIYETPAPAGAQP